jgi:hypothetical protein
MNRKRDYRRPARRARQSAERATELEALRALRGKRSNAITREAALTIRIADPSALAAHIRREIDARFGGNLSEAARAAGLSQPTLQRLSKGKSKQLGIETMARLHTFMPEDREVWGKAIVTDLATDSLIAYDQWFESYRKQVLFPEGVFPLHSTGPIPWAIPPREFHALVTKSRGVAPEIFADWEALLVTSKFTSKRMLLALVRIFEPLLTYGLSGGIERHWTELDDQELADFVRAGMRRELILLRRGADIARAQMAVTKPPVRSAIGEALGDDLWLMENFTAEWLMPRKRHP